MPVFETTQDLPHPLAEVWGWHTRPGALTRLSPEWAQTVLEESRPPLAPGALAKLRTAVPGTAGTVRVPFDVRHAAGPTDTSFVDEMVRGPLASWRHTHRFTTTDDGGTRVHDRIEYEAPGGHRASGLSERLTEPVMRSIFAARGERLTEELRLQRELGELSAGRSLNVLIGGASGMLGTQVAAVLTTGGHTVRRLVRRPARTPDEVPWDPSGDGVDPQQVAWADAIVHLGGASIARRFTAKNRKAIRDSRIDSTRALVQACAALPEQDRPEVLVCASAVGYYGASRGDELLTEDSASGEGFLAEVCRDWEAAAAGAEELGMRRVSLRHGVVLSSLGGILRAQLPLYLAGGGGPLAGGDQWFAWVSLDDAAALAARAVLDPRLSGPVNSVASEQLHQRDFARQLGEALHRPAVVPAPKLGPQALLGRQAADELATADQRVVPQAAQSAGFRFRHATLREALASTLPG